MKKKILSLALALAMTLSLAACSGRASAESVVKKAMDAVNPFNAEQVVAYWGDASMSNDVLNEEDAELIAALFEDMTYEIVSSEETDESATVTVKVTNTDMTAVMGGVLEEYLPAALAAAFDTSAEAMSEEELAQLFNDTMKKHLDSTDYETVENEATLTLTPTEDSWTITGGTEEALNAMMGGLTSALEELDSIG